MTVRRFLVAALAAAALAVPDAASAQSISNCRGQVQVPEMTFTAQGMGYGVVTIRFTARIRNTGTAALNATVSLGPGLPTGFLTQPPTTLSLPGSRTTDVFVGSFQGAGGSSPPSTADVLRKVTVRCQ